MPTPRKIEDIGVLLAKGEIVNIPGVGKLKIVDKAARTGRNPHTGGAVEIPAQKAVKFSIFDAFKKQLNPHLAR